MGRALAQIILRSEGAAGAPTGAVASDEVRDEGGGLMRSAELLLLPSSAEGGEDGLADGSVST